MKHTLWLKIAGTLQLLSAAFHSLSFFVGLQGSNDAETKLFESMKSIPMDTGIGTTTNMMNITNALSVSFALLLLFAGILNWYFIKRLDTSVLKGFTNVQILIFGILFAVCAWLTFLPPIVCTALVFVALVIARLTFPKEKEPYK